MPGLGLALHHKGIINIRDVRLYGVKLNDLTLVLLKCHSYSQSSVLRHTDQTIDQEPKRMHFSEEVYPLHLTDTFILAEQVQAVSAIQGSHFFCLPCMINNNICIHLFSMKCPWIFCFHTVDHVQRPVFVQFHISTSGAKTIVLTLSKAAGIYLFGIASEKPNDLCVRPGSRFKAEPICSSL